MGTEVVILSAAKNPAFDDFDYRIGALAFSGAASADVILFPKM